MPDPTLSDVLQAVNQMQNDVTFIKGKVEDIPSIKGNVQDANAKLDAASVKDIYIPCLGCNGTGTVEVSIQRPTGIGPDTELITCTRCSGVKFVKHGYDSI